MLYNRYLILYLIVALCILYELHKRQLIKLITYNNIINCT